MLILYASQTGNAQDAAERIGREAERRGCKAIVLSVHQYDVRLLSREEVVIFVVSTTGQGEPPDTMKTFWRFLLSKSLNQFWLKGMHYAVFGLGDSAYQKFNIVAKKLDKRLSDLGAHSIIERGLGDDQHPSGYEATLDLWLSSLWEGLKKRFSAMFQNGEFHFDAATKYLDCPKYRIVYHNGLDAELSQKSTLEDHTDALNEWSERIRARAMVEGSSDYNRGANVTIYGEPPHYVQMVKNEHITSEDSEKDVRHIEFDFPCADVHYEPGDVLEMMPSQDGGEVDAFIQRCGLDPNAYVTVEAVSSSSSLEDKCSSYSSLQKPVKLRTLVESTMDIASASPRRYFFEIMSHFATAEHEKERLQYFASPEGRDDLYQYNQKERRTVNEVLQDFPSVHLPFEWLLQLVPRLQTRKFSISSSILAHPHQVHITVAVVSWLTPFKRKRQGLCSSWLARLDPTQERVILPVWFRKGALRWPPLSVPLILVGPGTGCAPFRAFIEQREILNRKNSVGPILCFFGCRNKERDFLYKEFWLSHSNSGLLSTENGGGFFVAFSRDQPKKVYVQDKIKGEAKVVWNFLKSGSWVYVSGSATKMPADVWSALEEVVAKEGGFPREEASILLRQLEKGGKYHVEAWS